MLDDPEDGYRYCAYSNKKLSVHCPICGHQRILSPNEIKYKGFTCPCCSDGISYPEKFVANLFDQLGIDYETQYNPEWIKPRRFDFYISQHNIIVETHGLQHYKDCFINISHRTAIDETENDVDKALLALKNGVKKVIFLNCSISDLDFMK